VLRVTAEPIDAHSAVLRVSGDIDQDTVPDLDHAVHQSLGSGYTHLAIDCADLQSCDSSGITALLHAHHSATARGGTLRIRTGPRLRSRLRLTGLDQILTLTEDPPTPSAELLEVPPTADASGIESPTESLVRLTTHDTLAPAAADAPSAAAQPAPAPTIGPVRSREDLAALEQLHAARREARRQALNTARPQPPPHEPGSAPKLVRARERAAGLVPVVTARPGSRWR
jgi:anti-sigma B factor antagonist